MVVFRRWWVILVGITQLVMAGDVDIDTRVNAATAGENSPIEVLVVISRDPSSQVDESSFLLKNDAIEVEHLGDATKKSLTIINGKRTEENTTISRYRFYLPGQPSGLYILPSIRVKVDGQWYESDSSTYQVKKGQESGDFRLEAAVLGPSPLYPGQSATFIYRIYFKDNIELTVENLPLFDSPDFNLIGQKTVKSSVEGGFNVQEIVQRVEAKKSGTYRFDQSVIEGYAYKQDLFGRKNYSKDRLRSVAEPITVVVRPFPEAGKPSNFAGGVGPFDVSVSLISSSKVSVGDKIELLIIFSGGDLQTLQLPDIEKQGGFKGRFRFSDLPPVPQSDVTSKKYVLEIRPLTERVQEIPPITFSYFDPVRGVYEQISSEPIPIKVTSLKAPEPPQEAKSVEENTEIPEAPEESSDWREDVAQVQPIEIAGNFQLEEGDFDQSIFSTWKALWLIPFGASLIILQILFKRYWKRAKGWKKRHRSRLKFSEAMQTRDSAQVEQALLLRLFEKGLVKKKITTPEDLSKAGVTGEVRQFLLHLEEGRFAGEKVKLNWEEQQKARKLFERIRR